MFNLSRSTAACLGTLLSLLFLSILLLRPLRRIQRIAAVPLLSLPRFLAPFPATFAAVCTHSPVAYNPLSRRCFLTALPYTKPHVVVAVYLHNGYRRLASGVVL